MPLVMKGLGGDIGHKNTVVTSATTYRKGNSGRPNPSITTQSQNSKAHSATLPQVTVTENMTDRQQVENIPDRSGKRRRMSAVADSSNRGTTAVNYMDQDTGDVLPVWWINQMNTVCQFFSGQRVGSSHDVDMVPIIHGDTLFFCEMQTSPAINNVALAAKHIQAFTSLVHESFVTEQILMTFLASKIEEISASVESSLIVKMLEKLLCVAITEKIVSKVAVCIFFCDNVPMAQNVWKSASSMLLKYGGDCSPLQRCEIVRSILKRFDTIGM